MKSRIEDIIRAKGVSPTRFADLLNVQRSSISHILSGRNKPSMDFVEKLLDVFPDINSNWLISGKGKMFGDHQFVANSSSTVLPNQTEVVKNIAPESAAFDAPSLFDLPKTNVVKEVYDGNIVKSEEKIEYGKKNRVENAIEHNKARKISKIVLFYDDHSFEEFNHGL